MVAGQFCMVWGGLGLFSTYSGVVRFIFHDSKMKIGILDTKILFNQPLLLFCELEKHQSSHFMFPAMHKKRGLNVV
jgi:hypothetical protein